MNAVTQELRWAGRRLVGTPTAVFVAVLTAGFAMASAAHHLGFASANGAASRQSNVVLACPRTSAAKSASTGSRTSPNSAATATHSSAGSGASSTGPATTASSARSEKPATGRGGGLSMPLPDFNAPELSRFISPL